MAIERTPVSPVAQNFRPAGGTPYRVKNGDDWDCVARAAGVPVGQLIEFNFRTRNPDEVNWYLRRNVGCRKTTADGKTTFSVVMPTPASSTAAESAEHQLHGSRNLQHRRAAIKYDVLGGDCHDDDVVARQAKLPHSVSSGQMRVELGIDVLKWPRLDGR
jgi:hypothetical protein